ncbi:hypothetical protein [Comamonas sp.]|uniref:hypothetical protein n=1 Tax=Comamonas sp. TaxID=34028 RepID=UPI00289FF5B0|nr:hypothetical protein [Comamonas sp.]
MCSITEQLKSELRNVGAAAFPRIAQETGVALSFIRKFYYGGRENPRVQTIQPLIDYFRADLVSDCQSLVESQERS